MFLLRYQERPSQNIEDTLKQGIDFMESYKSPLKAEEPEWGIDGLVISPLRPDDVVLGATPSNTHGRWSMNLAQGWNASSINRTVPENYYFVITGVRKGAGSCVTEVQFAVAGKELLVVNIEEIDTWEERLCYFRKPFGVPPEKALTTHLRAHTANTTDFFGILGYKIVVADNGKQQQVSV